MSSKKNIGKNVAQIRRNKGLTQATLSEKAKISYSTLAKLERGAINDPSVFTIAEIARVLGVSVEQILDFASIPDTGINNSEKIKFVYCDVNGVLVRFYHRAFSKLASETSIPIERIESTFWHYNDTANRGEITLDDFNKAMELKLGLKPGKFDWEKRYMSAIEPIKDMHKCLEEISKTIKVGLLSDNYKGFLNKMIKSGLLPDIKYTSIVESASVGSKKPDQKIYEIAENMAKTPGSNIFFIDDSRGNLVEAEKRGWRVMWFDDYRPKESARRVAQAINVSKV